MTNWKDTWMLPLSRTLGAGPVPALWYGIGLLTLTAVYFGTGHFGLSLGAFSGFATLVWLPSGIAVASLFLWGYRLWPGIALGAFDCFPKHMQMYAWWPSPPINGID